MLSAILSQLPGVQETIQGALVSGLVWLFRAVAPKAWKSYGTLLRFLFVAAVAALWAGFSGYFLLGLSGVALVTHVGAAFGMAIGLRQVVKAPKKSREEKNKNPLRGLTTKL